MPAVKFRVTLTDAEVEMLDSSLRKGKSAACTQTRPRILLKAAAGCRDAAIMEALEVSATMIYNTRQECVEAGVDAALHDRPRPGQSPKLSDQQCAPVIATACTPASAGHDHWTLRLLTDKVVQLGYADSFSYETVRRLFKNTLKPWQVQEWCIPEASADFVAAMEDVLELSESPYDPLHPVVCYDESPKQLIGEVCAFFPVRPGMTARQDTEYCRNGVRDLMMIFEPKRGWREVLMMEH